MTFVRMSPRNLNMPMLPSVLSLKFATHSTRSRYCQHKQNAGPSTPLRSAQDNTLRYELQTHHPRRYPHILKSEPCAGECCAGAEGFDGSAVAGAEAAELLEAIEASFDVVSLLVQGAIVAARLLPVASWRDNGDRTQGLDGGDDLGRVVALVGDDGFGMLALQQAD
jgi:hypothetical protein